MSPIYPEVASGGHLIRLSCERQICASYLGRTDLQHEFPCCSRTQIEIGRGKGGIEMAGRESNLGQLGAAGSFIARPQVLLIDEDADDLGYNEAMLRKLGCEVTSCVSYREGLRSMCAVDWDFVMVSQGGPTFAGRSILEAAVNGNRSLPVIVLAKWHNLPCYLEALQLGAADYLEKPVSLWELARVLETHLPWRLDAPRSAQAEEPRAGL